MHVQAHVHTGSPWLVLNRHVFLAAEVLWHPSPTILKDSGLLLHLENTDVLPVRARTKLSVKDNFKALKFLLIKNIVCPPAYSRIGRANGKNHYTGKGPVIGSDYNQSLVNSLQEPAIQTHQTQKVNKKKINKRLGLESVPRCSLSPGEGQRLLSSLYLRHTDSASQCTQLRPTSGQRGQTHPGNRRTSACCLPRSPHPNRPKGPSYFTSPLPRFSSEETG